jgi:hypothetical protein
MTILSKTIFLVLALIIAAMIWLPQLAMTVFCLALICVAASAIGAVLFFCLGAACIAGNADI